MSTKQVSVARFELLMDAGCGAQKVGDILVKAFANTNRHVFIEPMIPAEISPPKRTKPALSGTMIRVADFELTNMGNTSDVLLAQHEIVLDRRLDDEEHRKDVIILLDMGDKKNNESSYENVCKRATKEGLNITPIFVSDEAKTKMKSLAGRGINIYYLGILAGIYSLDRQVVIDEIKATFGAKLKEEVLNANLDLFAYGYDFMKENISISYDVAQTTTTFNKKILIDGNTSMSMGIIDAGIKIFSGYPITPASSIMHTLAKILPAYGGIVHQAEDEISAIGTAIGAYFTGTPSVTVTSGPGVSLKQEFIGYANVSETPLILIDVQRSGPSTGMPTKSEQSDLPCVIFGSHGDNNKIVIGVGNIIDCFYAPQVARYLTEKLRLPVFIMSDFQMANSYTILEKPQTSEMDDIETIADSILERFYMKRLPDDIEMVRDIQAKPGTPGGMRRITGLNTDSEGKVSYFAKTNQRSHAVRNEKVHHVQRALRCPDFMGGVTEGDLLIVGWGTTEGALQEAVEHLQEEGLKVGGMCFKIVYPLPLDLAEVFSKFSRVVTVEMAYGDALKKTPLAMFLRSKTLVDVLPIVSRATGRPIAPATIEESAKEVLNGK